MRKRVTMTVKEALTDKEYRKRGGVFRFPSPLDTFIRGLHRRTSDLHADWMDSVDHETSGDAARTAAVAEMLLRLRWDDKDDKARVKLSKMVATIWDGLEGVDQSATEPISSALWLDEVEDRGVKVVETESQVHHQPRGGTASVNRQVPPQTTDPLGSPGHSAMSTPQPTSELPIGKGKGEGKGAEGKGAEGKGAEGKGAEGKGAEGKGAEGKGAKGKGAKGKGAKGKSAKGKGAKSGFRTVVVGRDAAREAMDSGLQSTLDALPVDLRGRMNSFAADQVSGRRVKLPLNLKAKQRKAIHLWAEMQGLEHQSFGYRGGRRLHLIVPGDRAEGDDDEEWGG